MGRECPLLTDWGMLGECRTLPHRGEGVEPSPKMVVMHFEARRTPFVAPFKH